MSSSKLQYCCGSCPKKFKKQSSLSSHILSHTKADLRACPQCSRVLRARHLPRHIRTHSESRPLKCKSCSKTFNEQCDLTKHIRTHTGEKPYVCSECPKAYPTSSALVAHRRDHTQELLCCTYCPMKFKSAWDRNDHLRIHTGVSDFMCTFCQFPARSSKDLERHMVVHTKERAFQCDKCMKSYGTKSGLKRHKNSHLNKKFRCGFCHYQTHIEHNMNDHIRRHVGETTHQCPDCTHASVSAGDLRIHLKTHGIKSKTFACDICLKKLLSQQNLDNHKRLHNASREFECRFCEMHFRKSSTMKWHVKKKHPVSSRNTTKPSSTQKCLEVAADSRVPKMRADAEAELPKLQIREIRICLTRIDL